MKQFALLIGLLAAISVACTVGAPPPATPAGGGALPTATRPPSLTNANAGGGGGTPADQGKALLTAKGCVACHTVSGLPGAVGTIGPNLSDVGDPAKHPKIAGGVLDNNPDNMRRWLVNPPGVKPGTQMPNLNLTPQEIDALLAFLQTLK